MAGAAAPLVRSIAGLDTGKYEHPLIAMNATLPGNKGPATLSAAVSPASSSFFSNNCFNGVETETFSTNNDGSLPIGTYKGNHLNLQV